MSQVQKGSLICAAAEGKLRDGSVAGAGIEIGRYANLVAVGATRRMLASPIIPALPCACDEAFFHMLMEPKHCEIPTFALMEVLTLNNCAQENFI